MRNNVSRDVNNRELMGTVVPGRVQWTIVHEHVHILGERELNVLYSRSLMNVIVNAFILAFVNGAFSQFYFFQDSARFSSSLPDENRLKHTVNRP